ncbi:toxin-antitoxin system TumE family protein [Rhodanobacter umsongensis]
MKAKLLLRERQSLTETAFIEAIIWHVPKPVAGSDHGYKYSLALVAEGVCVLRYDNEAGKGGHRHVADREAAYRFIDLATLQTDFWNDVETWRKAR